MADIRWFGHACVLIRAREATILMDPVPRSFGYRFPKQRADIVTISHDHPGHTATEVASGDFKLINGPGEYEISDVFITGVRTYHDKEKGAKLGRNTIYVVEVEGVTVCHLGDLGHELSEEQSGALESVDVLLVPVGGGPTFDGARAAEVVGHIEPQVVIPIQYRTEYGDAEREDVQRFLTEMGAGGEITPVDRYTIKRADIASTGTEVILLTCAATGK